MKKDSEAKSGRLVSFLQKSPINYFSDLFVCVMVIAWIIQIIIENWAAIYATVMYADLSVWSEVGELVRTPLTAGGAIWMVKNSVQHAIANHKGKQAHMDFPKVDVEDIELEKEIITDEDTDEDTDEETDDQEGEEKG